MKRTLLGGVAVVLCVCAVQPALALPEPQSQPSRDAAVALKLRNGEPLVLPRRTESDVNMRIDGRLDEPEWHDALIIDDLRVLEPDLLVQPRYRTVLRLFYTERGLYVSFDNEQPAETIIKRLSQRDDGGLNRDSVSFTLDTSGRGRYGYWMGLALGNNQIDGTIMPERQYSRDWDGAWYGGTAEHDAGWSAEIFVPWSQMAMAESGKTRQLGIYASRKVAHLNERWGWPALPRSQARFMSALQPLILEDVNPRQQWSFFPYSSTTVDGIAGNQQVKAGFDVFWRPSSNFQLAAAANPDFGGVESDDVVVNLSALETFFAEKRLFFLEGQEIFRTTPRDDWGDPVTLLNTRRIGGPPLMPDAALGLTFPDRELNQPSELHGALKATGQMGPLRFGMLGASEQDTPLRSSQGQRYVQGGRDFGAARWLYEDNVAGAYRALGWLGTTVRHDQRDAAVQGVDFHYLTADGQWKYDGQLMYSDVDGLGAGRGGFLDVQFTPRTGLKLRANLSRYDDKLAINDLGFLSRNDVADVRLSVDWIRSGLERVRDVEIKPFLRHERNGDGLTTNASIGSRFNVTLNNLDELETRLAYFPGRYDDLNSFGNGAYRLPGRAAASLFYRTDTAKPLSVFARTDYRDDGVDGHHWRHSAGVVWRPLDVVNLQLESTYAERDGWLLHQQGRNMTAFAAEEWQPKLKMDFFLSARQQFRLALQWVGIKAREQDFYEVPVHPGALLPVDRPAGPADDFNISQVNFQLRYRWQIAPLSDLFVVYTRSGQQAPAEAAFGDLFQQAWDDPSSDQLVVKLRYRLGT